MPTDEPFFQQSNIKLPPAKDEIFATAIDTFRGYEVEMHVIGTSHHLSVGSAYTERLACDDNISEKLSSKVYNFQQLTQLGTFYSTIWQENYDNDFGVLEKSYLHESWNLLHCFREHSAFTGIRITDMEIQTIHSYPEHLSLIFSKTRLIERRAGPGDS